MNKFYAGIGSRETPNKFAPIIRDIALFLESDGYILRSGGAPGADKMFEAAITDKTKKHIYVPWYCFQSSTSPLCRVSQEAIEFSLKYHPAPHKLSESVRKLMGRNAYQVLGEDLKTKADFIVCYTDNGAESGPELYHCGGTGQALRIAEAHGIKIFNLRSRTAEDFKKWYSDNNFDLM